MNLYMAKSATHGFGLFSNKLLNPEENIAQVFKRINNTGVFTNDFRETPFGRATNHSDNPNAKIVVEADGIYLLAGKEIKAREEITASYHELIALFNNDPTLIKLIRFWK